MRLLCWLIKILTCLSIVTAVNAAETKAEVERRARVALALSVADGVAGCGKCRGDLDECRLECFKTGQPMVLFVGGCDGRAQELPPGIIPCRVPTYPGDKRGSEKRILVIGPKAGDGESLYIWETLPADVSAEKLRAALGVAQKAAPVAINWGF